MNSLKIFVITAVEVSNFMLLWNMLNGRNERRLLKSTAIILLTSLVVVLTNLLYISVEFIINYLFLMIAIKVIFGKNIRNLLLEFSLLLSVCGILQLLVIVTLRTLSPTFMAEDVFLNNLTANVFCLILSLVAYKLVGTERISRLYKRQSPKINFFSVNLLLYVVIAKWIWNYNRQMFLEEIIFFIVLPAVFILGNMVFIVYHTRNTELKRSLEEYKKYSAVISELLEDVRRKQHDFKNHLNTIYGLIQVSDEKNLKETVRKYMNSVNLSLESIDRVLQINNKVVTAIIYNKMNEAEAEKIKFIHNIQGGAVTFPFKDNELSEVLNNLLDNAFEAVMSSEREVRKVYLTMGSLEEGCIIEIGNTGNRIELKDIGRIFDIGYTTKKGEGRGYGLHNVKKIVESYGGRIQLAFENNYTIFKVMLPQ